jgi:hypothetical protein
VKKKTRPTWQAMLVVPLPAGGGMMKLHVLCLTEGCALISVQDGREAHASPFCLAVDLVPECLALPLEDFDEQGIPGPDATISCTYIPTDLHAAWCFIQGVQVLDGESALEGVTSLKVETDGAYLRNLPHSLESLTFGAEFSHSLQTVNFPDFHFNNSLATLTLPSSVQKLIFGDEFNQSLTKVTWQQVQLESGSGDLASFNT